MSPYGSHCPCEVLGCGVCWPEPSPKAYFSGICGSCSSHLSLSLLLKILKCHLAV